jgi:putative flippase GtrA
MTDLSPRSDRTPSRRAREARAYRLVLAGGTAAAVAVVTFVLALVGVMSFGPPVLAALVAAICIVLFRRMVAR